MGGWTWWDYQSTPTDVLEAICRQIDQQAQQQGKQAIGNRV